MTNCSPDCAEINAGHCPGASCVYRPDEAPAEAFAAEQRLMKAATAYAILPTTDSWSTFLSASDEYRQVAR